MYVVGSFPNFLMGHWPFLKTVIKKLNEFMHERHPGVQDMACETFLKISQLTKHMFTQFNEGPNVQPYVYDLINMMPENLKDLQPHQELMIYEGIGYMVSTEQETKLQDLINKLMGEANKAWGNILSQAEQQNDILLQPHVLRNLSHIVKINQKVALSVGAPYLCYLSVIFQNAINVYNLYSKCITDQVRTNKPSEMLRPMKILRRDILKLLQTYIDKEENLQYFN